MMGTKICKKCGRELPLREFSKNKGRKDGHNAWCKECYKQYRREHNEELVEYFKQHYQDNKEVIIERQKQYQQEHKEERAEYAKQYQQEHKEEIAEYKKQYQNTPMGRAANLVSNYQYNDKKYNRGECTLTAQWIVDNIFNKPCHYNCGETDWTKLGCDRINNDLPHTPDNVVPCCEECNNKRGTKTYEEFLKLIKAPVTYIF